MNILLNLYVLLCKVYICNILNSNYDWLIVIIYQQLKIKNRAYYSKKCLVEIFR